MICTPLQKLSLAYWSALHWIKKKV